MPARIYDSFALLKLLQREPRYQRVAKLLDEDRRPHTVLITCGSGGCLVVRRAAGAEPAYKLHCLAVEETAPMGPGLLGAGDVLRAALIEGLLRLEDSKEQGGRLARPVSQADILELVSIAQYASYKWLRREPKEDYFGSFPSSYEDLQDEYRRSVDKRRP